MIDSCIISSESCYSDIFDNLETMSEEFNISYSKNHKINKKRNNKKSFILKINFKINKKELYIKKSKSSVF